MLLGVSGPDCGTVPAEKSEGTGKQPESSQGKASLGSSIAMDG